jgi:serine O-acetyltransferase
VRNDSPDPTRADHALATRLVEHHRRPVALPPRRDVERSVDEIVCLLFPEVSGCAGATVADVAARLAAIRRDLGMLLGALMPPDVAREAADRFIAQLPGISADLRLDAGAIVDGDPAAGSLDEVVMAYPGLLAVTIHRIAHGLHQLGVPIVPRLLAEVGHSRTGVDIHPAAAIGRSFCIDHGTGVVIGETAVVGDHVTVYHGVTLGALSVAKEAAGTKRHPTVEDRVVLYANATVLGGDTVVGHDSVIGGNVWLATSVAPHSFVYHTSQVRVRHVQDALQPSDYSI